MKRFALALLLALASIARAENPVLTRATLERVTAATVFIRCSYATSTDPANPATLFSDGSGFAVSPSGLVITNRHVVAPSVEHNGTTYFLRGIAVHVNCGTPERREYRGVMLAAYELPVDLALLRIRPDGKLTALETDSMWIGEQELALTERVWAIGFPLGMGMEDALSGADMTRNPNGPDISVREGSVTAFRRDDAGKVKAVEHSCNIEHGNSGGPLVNRKGQVVGVNALGVADTDFAIPLRQVLEHFGRTLGWVAGNFPTTDLATQRVLRVDPAAEKSDRTFATIEEAIAAARAGDTVELAPGQFNLKAPLRIPGRIWVRGAGRELTTVTASRDHRLGMEVGSGGDYTELSDMTIECVLGPAVAARETAIHETYLHDLALTNFAGGAALVIEAGGAPHVVACEVHPKVLLRGPGGRARFAQCSLRDLTVDKASADFEVCRFLLPHEIAIEGAKVRFTACAFSTAVLNDTDALLQSCHHVTGAPYGGTIVVQGASSLRILKGMFSGEAGFAIAGAGAKATVEGTVISTTWASPAFTVRNGATANFQRCRFFFQSPGAHITLSPARAQAANFGVAIRGAGSRATLTDCTFQSGIGGIAISVTEGGQLKETRTLFRGVTRNVAYE